METKIEMENAGRESTKGSQRKETRGEGRWTGTGFRRWLFHWDRIQGFAV